MTAHELAQTLRRLRERHYGRKIPQKVLAAALGVSPPSISSWEGGVIPPPDRLRAYAVLFASPRWLESGSTPNLDPARLDEPERKTYHTLIERLDAEAKQAGSVVAEAAAPPADFWSFPDGGHIRVLCGKLNPDPAVPYANPTDHNYIELRATADADALLQLWGHLHARNPDADIRFRVGQDRVSADDRKAHLVIIGNIAQMQGAGELLPPGALPVEQVDAPNLDGEIFRLTGDHTTTFEPTIVDDVVTEDVGLLARVPNPNFAGRSITVCSGVFTRGVLGAVRLLIDRDLRDLNATALQDGVPSLDDFAVLMRVRVTRGDTDTPDLRLSDTWRYPTDEESAPE